DGRRGGGCRASGEQRRAERRRRNRHRALPRRGRRRQAHGRTDHPDAQEVLRRTGVDHALVPLRELDGDVLGARDEDELPLTDWSSLNPSKAKNDFAASTSLTATVT